MKNDLNKKCIKCKQIFQYSENDTWIDYNGSYYDTKLVECNKCGALNILYYYFYQLNYNDDERYYDLRDYWNIEQKEYNELGIKCKFKKQRKDE